MSRRRSALSKMTYRVSSVDQAVPSASRIRAACNVTAWVAAASADRGEARGEVDGEASAALAGDDGAVSAAEGQGKTDSASTWMKRGMSPHLL